MLSKSLPALTYSEDPGFSPRVPPLGEAAAGLTAGAASMAAATMGNGNGNAMAMGMGNATGATGNATGTGTGMGMGMGMTTVDPYAKKPFTYRGKVFDTTTSLDKSILKERDMSKKVRYVLLCYIIL
jgi:hypothetical protein